ncbi:Hypothetical protein EHLA_2012 [Anaerobutyricum hallii]|uniref:Uncharacterized protein n=1 Tax=Anaerobutyricum hallii TaxID=39488 RepID=A0A285PXD7_9FIRM|nr:hypothetical protein [Anaerobutyricum hallii]SOB72645.1 Hypothetical protein EHLA_2012 [Anaerobutyricum hallii]
MKKTIFVLGIIFILISVIAFLIGGLFCYVSNHMLDGPAGLYAHQRAIMMTAIICGIILLVVGVVFLILSKKMR